MFRLLPPARVGSLAAAALLALPGVALASESAPESTPDEAAAPSEASPAPALAPNEAAEPAPAVAATRPDLAAVLRASRPVPRGADAPSRTPRGQRYDVWANARVRSTSTAAFALDNDGFTNPQGTRYEPRILHGLSYAPSRRIQIHLEADILNGQFAGDTTDVGTSIGDDTFRERRNEDFTFGYALPRKAYINILTDWALLQIGQQSFTWGTGYLANDGAGDPDFGDAK